MSGARANTAILTDNVAVGDARSFAWDLGNGTTGSAVVPPSSHTYGDDGAYEIMLAVADGRGGVDTARTTVTSSNAAPTIAPFSMPATPFGLRLSGVSLTAMRPDSAPTRRRAHM